MPVVPAVQFEGSLGRLTASSVHNPRQIIDVSVNKEVSGEDAKTKMGRRFKQLLLEIEKVTAIQQASATLSGALLMSVNIEIASFDIHVYLRHDLGQV